MTPENQQIIDDLIACAAKGDFLMCHLNGVSGNAACLIKNHAELSLNSRRSLLDANNVAISWRIIWRFLKTEENRKKFLFSMDAAVLNLMPFFKPFMNLMERFLFLKKMYRHSLNARFFMFNLIYS